MNVCELSECNDVACREVGVSSRRRRLRRAGFTLVELVLVIAVAGVVSGIAVVGYQSTTRSTKDEAAELSFRSFLRNVNYLANTDRVITAGDVAAAGDDGFTGWSIAEQGVAVSSQRTIGFELAADGGAAGFVTVLPSGSVLQGCVTPSLIAVRDMGSAMSPSPAFALPCSEELEYADEIAVAAAAAAAAGTTVPPTTTPVTPAPAPWVVVARPITDAMAFGSGSARLEMRVNTSLLDPSYPSIQWERDGVSVGTFSWTSRYYFNWLTVGTSYTYRFRQVDLAPNPDRFGPWSDEIVTTPLPAPVNQVATAGDGEVTLSWDAAQLATMYNIRWYLTHRGHYVGSGSASTASTSYVVDGLAPGVSYSFEVSSSAPVIGGESSYRGWPSAVPTEPAPVVPAGVTVPGVPSGLAVTSSEFTDHAGSISWAAPVDDGGDAVFNYVVQFRNGTSGSWETWNAFDDASTLRALEVNDYGSVSTGNSMQLRVAAENVAGVGAFTDPVTTFNYFGG